MVATNYDKAKNLYAMTPDGSTNFVTDAALQAGKQLNNDLVLQGKFGSSDHVPFAEAGIPVALFIWMGVDSWNPLIYHIEKVYHTPQDNVLENISPERMKMALDVIGTGVYNSLQNLLLKLNRKCLINKRPLIFISGLLLRKIYMHKSIFYPTHYRIQY